ncbi:hypothetical protein [Carboxylicivirga sp. RSCT41]|uniref:hypothetical protein n=1 Tax=Carboxylicivirga agarovorans TaxID=3417570 RepID=UPI003D35726F
MNNNTMENIKEWSVTFDKSNENTCYKEWQVNMAEVDGEKIVKSVEYEAGRHGCVGHPKSIVALSAERPLSSFDLQALSQTDCVRDKSCGIIFGECLSAIKAGSAK